MRRQLSVLTVAPARSVKPLSSTLEIGIWPAVAVVLGGEVARPLLVLDAGGVIIMMNAAAETQLRWPFGALVDQPLMAIVPAHRREVLVSELERAGRGEVRTGEIPMMTPSGDLLVLRVRFIVAQAGDQVALVCDLESVAVEAELFHWSDGWMDIRLDDFGLVERASGDGAHAVAGRRCYVVVAGLDEPCPRCPIPDLPVGRQFSDAETLLDDRTLVRRVVRTSETTARIAHTVLAPRLVRDLILARLHAVATRAGLSEREREVLHELIEGHSLAKIADALRISERTVRFHQTNVLDKLGVGSRVEILRLLL